MLIPPARSSGAREKSGGEARRQLRTSRTAARTMRFMVPLCVVAATLAGLAAAHPQTDFAARDLSKQVRSSSWPAPPLPARGAQPRNGKKAGERFSGFGLEEAELADFGGDFAPPKPEVGYEHHPHPPAVYEGPVYVSEPGYGHGHGHGHGIGARLGLGGGRVQPIDMFATGLRYLSFLEGAQYDHYGNRKHKHGYAKATARKDVEVEAVPEKRSDENRKSGFEYPEPPSGDYYKPASGPAYGPSPVSDFHANPRFDPLPYAHADVGAEQKQLQDAVYAGANAYQPDGVYQTEDRLEFQIHGQQGPHSYRYGYDTGNGYNRQFRYEERDDKGFVKGRYGFFDRNGKLQIVNYTADPHKGFHAEGDRVPSYPH